MAARLAAARAPAKRRRPIPAERAHAKAISAGFRTVFPAVRQSRDTPLDSGRAAE